MENNKHKRLQTTAANRSTGKTETKSAHLTSLVWCTSLYAMLC